MTTQHIEAYALREGRSYELDEMTGNFDNALIGLSLCFEEDMTVRAQVVEMESAIVDIPDGRELHRIHATEETLLVRAALALEQGRARVRRCLTGLVEQGQHQAVLEGALVFRSLEQARDGTYESEDVHPVVEAFDKMQPSVPVIVQTGEGVVGLLIDRAPTVTVSRDCVPKAFVNVTLRQLNGQDIVTEHFNAEQITDVGQIAVGPDGIQQFVDTYQPRGCSATTTLQELYSVRECVHQLQTTGLEIDTSPIERQIALTEREHARMAKKGRGIIGLGFWGL